MIALKVLRERKPITRINGYVCSCCEKQFFGGMYWLTTTDTKKVYPICPTCWPLVLDDLEEKMKETR